MTDTELRIAAADRNTAAIDDLRTCADRTADAGADLRERVRARYAAAATGNTAQDSCCGPDCCASPAAATANAAQDSCCGPDCCAPDSSLPDTDAGDGFGAALYTIEDTRDLPDAAVLASLGCGNPTAVAALEPGETVLDLGSGGGIDVLLSARRVGPTGHAYGLDMTDEMLDLARRNAEAAGATNVTFLKGHIEDVPLSDASVDVIISNCVVNLSVDKPAVMAEMHRVLRPGGRIGISDVVAEDHLGTEDRAERGSYVGCIAGALSETEYRDLLSAAGFLDVDITFTHGVADGMHSAIVRATKP